MKILEGIVVSKKMNKTATILVENTSVHPLYGKRFIRSKKYHVHDDLDSKTGDAVLFVASKPYSKNVKWKIIKINSGKKAAKEKVEERSKKS